ncbi:ABC1 kinase family protein [Nocardia callitridis]|uniref:AarF/ABC1/UbiB kinase family protein n=1 Tax=Nocardia callitridis TaxID=648753 RepID=A0ABP9JW23_9NOCA
MSISRVGRPPDEGRGGRGSRRFLPSSSDKPPVHKAVRGAKLATIPVAFAGRRAAGLGKRALGRSAEEVNRDIQLRTAQHMFEVLGELKGCAAKLGQLLAIYELALPPDLAAPYRAALSLLQDSAPTMLPRTVHLAMAESMGAGWRSEFLEFDDRRAAAASLGQVHRGVWHDGTPVAVKVMYPGGRAAVAADLEHLRRISYLAGVFLPGADVKSVIEAICVCISAELDYPAEAEFQQRFVDAYAGDPDIHVPRVVEVRGDVLITEWVSGTPLSHVIEWGTKTERDRVGMLMIRFITSAWGRHGLLYADPHPGNFRILPDGRLGVFDFGACSTWPPDDSFEQLGIDCCEAIFGGGPADLEAAIRRYGFVEPGRPIDCAALLAAVTPIGEPLHQPTFRLSNRWLRKQVLRTTNPTLTNVFREVTMPAYFTPFARSLLTLVGVLCQLETEGAFLEEVRRWLPTYAEAISPRGGRPTDTNAGDAPIDLGAARRRRDAGRTAR